MLINVLIKQHNMTIFKMNICPVNHHSITDKNYLSEKLRHNRFISYNKDTVTPTPTAKKSRPIIANTKALFLANVDPTEEL